MSETNTAGNGFVGYEYKDMTAPRDMEAVYVDGYTNFGWSLEGSDSLSTLQGTGTVNLKFKRDRKTRNKAELTRLQRQFEACATEIISLERSKSVTASIVAYALGIFGSAFLAGSVFAYIGGLLPLSIILAVPGFLGWIVPYFAYRKLKKDKTAKLSPIIEQKYDEIYTTCEKANGLLNA